MEVLIFTLFISLLLAVLFIVLFLSDRRNRRSGSLDQEALLPFGDERGESDLKKLPKKNNSRVDVTQIEV